MANPILHAISSGYTSRQVINHLLRIFPNHANAINSALAAGFSADQILAYLSKGRKAANDVTAFGGEKTEFENIREKEIENEEKRKRNTLLAALGIGTAGAGLGAVSAAFSRAAPQILPPLARAAPQLAGPGAVLNLPYTPIQPQPTSPTAPINPVNPIAPINSQSNPQSQPVQQNQPIAPTFNGNITEIFKSLNASDAIDTYAKAGNSPEIIEAFLKQFHPKTIKEIEKISGMSAKDAISAYLNENSVKSGEISVKNAEIPQIQEKKSHEMEEMNSEVSKFPHTMPDKKLINDDITEEMINDDIKKDSLVSSPKGVGTVLEVRGNEALLDIDGKTHKVRLDEIESSPVNEKDLAELHDDLLRGIEKETGEDVSRMVQWAGYNPETNTLQFLPHTGKLYKYKNISSEDAALLRDILSTRKTSGSNLIGAWTAGSKSPIGAALSKLIKRLQSERGGKGNEYEETHDTLYSAYEPAIQFKKEKNRKRKKKK